MSPLVDMLIGPIAKLLDKVIPDKDKREEMAHQIAVMAESQAHAQIMAQMEVNKIEAAHKSLYVAGWRPGAGWLCVTAMGINFVIAPLLNWAAMLNNWMVDHGDGVVSLVEVPTLDLSIMMPVLLGMLGLGGMRSYEKRNGVAREK